MFCFCNRGTKKKYILVSSQRNSAEWEGKPQKEEKTMKTEAGETKQKEETKGWRSKATLTTETLHDCSKEFAECTCCSTSSPVHEVVPPCHPVTVQDRRWPKVKRWAVRCATSLEMPLLWFLWGSEIFRRWQWSADWSQCSVEERERKRKYTEGVKTMCGWSNTLCILYILYYILLLITTATRSSTLICHGVCTPHLCGFLKGT